MALDDVKKIYTERDNHFYRDNYHKILSLLIGLLFILFIVLTVVFYQVMHRPLPQFNAQQPDGKSMLLISSDEPNLLPDTILRWASKAATVAYTFDFLRYQSQINAAREYFTYLGWQQYQESVKKLLQTVRSNKLFVYGVVSGTPVISNQGDIPGKGYVWRVQIPFLVTYQSENTVTKNDFIVVLSIVRVPTSENKQAIGIDQFLMVET
jgi:intracellular multiplication protein IcmL